MSPILRVRLCIGTLERSTALSADSGGLTGANSSTRSGGKSCRQVGRTSGRSSLEPQTLRSRAAHRVAAPLAGERASERAISKTAQQYMKTNWRAPSANGNWCTADEQIAPVGRAAVRGLINGPEDRNLTRLFGVTSQTSLTKGKKKKNHWTKPSACFYNAV